MHPVMLCLRAPQEASKQPLRWQGRRSSASLWRNFGPTASGFFHGPGVAMSVAPLAHPKPLQMLTSPTNLFYHHDGHRNHQQQQLQWQRHHESAPRLRQNLSCAFRDTNTQSHIPCSDDDDTPGHQTKDRSEARHVAKPDTQSTEFGTPQHEPTAAETPAASWL